MTATWILPRPSSFQVGVGLWVYVWRPSKHCYLKPVQIETPTLLVGRRCNFLPFGVSEHCFSFPHLVLTHLLQHPHLGSLCFSPLDVSCLFLCLLTLFSLFYQGKSPLSYCSKQEGKAAIFWDLKQPQEPFCRKGKVKTEYLLSQLVASIGHTPSVGSPWTICFLLPAYQCVVGA